MMGAAAWPGCASCAHGSHAGAAGITGDGGAE